MNDTDIPAPRDDLPHAAEPPATQQAYGAAAGTPAYRMSARDVLTQLFYHSKLLRNCILFGLALGLVAAGLAHTYYTADSLMLVFVGSESAAAQDASVTGPAVVSVDGLQVMQSELQIIQTDRVVGSAVEQVGPAVIYPALTGPRWFGLLPARDQKTLLGVAIQKFRGDLRVETEPSSNIIRISFTHPDHDIAVRSLQAVLDAYLTQRRAIYTNTNSLFLNQEIARYEQNLHNLDTEIEGLRTRYDVLDMAQDVVLATNRLDGIIQRQNQVRERRVAVQTEIVAVKANLATQPETVLDFRETTNNTGNDEARNTLVRLEQERTYLMSQYNANWPALSEVEKKIATARAQMGAKNQNLYFSERNIRNPALAVLNNRLASLEVEDKALGQQLGELEDQSHQADQRIKSLREADSKLHSLQFTRDVAEGVYRQLYLKKPATVFQDSIVGERNANLRVVQPPTAPVIGHTMAVSYLVGGAFLGLLLGIAATLVATVLRDVYIAPTEAERDLSMPGLAAFGSNALTGDTAGDQPDIANFAALLQEVTVEGRPLGSLQFVGLSEGDGRAGVIRALAVELATGYARRTLLLDLQGDGNAHALALGQKPAAPAPAQTAPIQVVSTDVSDLWVALDAPQSIFGDPRVSVARIRLALESLRQQFAMLLVIAPADLTAHAMRRLASLVDANVIVLRAEHTRSPVATRLRDALLTAGGNILGFIFVGRKYYIPNWLYRWI